MIYSLEGKWKAVLDEQMEGEIFLPGTLDESGLGHKDKGSNQWHPDASIGNATSAIEENAPIATRFTRKYSYEGEVALSRKIAFFPPTGKRIFLEAERARCLRLLVNNMEVPGYRESSISTPHMFEVTGLLKGNDEITLLSDNSYPGLPHDCIVYSSAATDETQTNWNGVLGYIQFRTEEPVFIEKVRVYPNKDCVTVKVEISANQTYRTTLTLRSDALAESFSSEISGTAGISEVVFENLTLSLDVKRWDEYEGNLCEMTAALSGQEAKTTVFGIRDFRDNGNGRLEINGRTIFLRSEANCAVFPETGHPPMTTGEWLSILKTYQSYGINCMRFHSYCPPEAAFFAADQLGMMMQPELSHWNPKNAFQADDSFRYYQIELREMIRMLANHPSFVMLTFGNELWTDAVGRERMSLMLNEARKEDPTRLYANGSNVHYGTLGCDSDSDFYTAQCFHEYPLRGTFAGMPDAETVKIEDDGESIVSKERKTTARIKGFINNQYPNGKTSYNDAMEKLRKEYKRPVFNFEVGQFEILPDFDELNEFQGISDPVNIRLIQEKVTELGLLPVWKQYVEATGEIAKLAYREEIEAAMRTEGLSGISLLGLQDFPGQGTALVGVLNSHLQPKPFDFAKPEGFQAFFRDQLPLALLPKYTYEEGEIFTSEIVIANFGKKSVTGELHYELKGLEIISTGTLGKICCPVGMSTPVGSVRISLQGIGKAERCDLRIWVGEVSNTYPIWIYPKVKPACPDSIYETEQLDAKAKEVLASGGKVFLMPPSTQDCLPNSIQAQFTTDFWSVGTFAMQEGGMGQLIDAAHPLFKHFPTETYTNWQWWPMASQRAVILEKPIKSIVTEMDSYAYMRPMSQLFECKCSNGKLMFSTMGLQNLQEYTEARALLHAIYQYMDTEEFAPIQEIDFNTIASLLEI